MSGMEVAIGVVQGVALIALLSATGLVLFNVLVGAWSRDGRLIAVLAGVAVGAHALLIPLHRSRAGGAEDAEQALTATILAGIGLLAALSAVVGLDRTMARDGIWNAWVQRRLGGLLGGSVLALGGLPLSGNPLLAEDVLAAAGLDLVHALAGAVWLGGAIGLWRLATQREIDPDHAAWALRRVAVAGAVAIVAVAATGVLLGRAFAVDAGSLPDSTYGRLLLAKLAALLVPLAIALWMRLQLAPTLAGMPGDDTVRAALHRAVAVESGGIAIALLLTGLLVSQAA